MLNLTKPLGTVALAIAGLGLQAEDFTSLMQVVKTTWPEKNHIGVICDYRSSQAQVDALAVAAGADCHITVVDVQTPEKAPLGARMMANRNANLLVLLPNDRLVRDGSFDGTLAVRRLARLGIPSVGTSSRSIAQGTVFSVGDSTNGELIVTDKLIGTVNVILPDKVTFSAKSSLRLAEPRKEGTATIAVVPVK